MLQGAESNQQCLEDVIEIQKTAVRNLHEDLRQQARITLDVHTYELLYHNKIFLMSSLQLAQDAEARRDAAAQVKKQSLIVDAELEIESDIQIQRLAVERLSAHANRVAASSQVVPCNN